MAQYTHLQLYRTSYNLLLEVMHVTKNFPREFKYSLGEKIQNAIVELLICIYKANSARDRAGFILQIIEYAQFLGVYFRISFDLKIITEIKYTHFTQELASVSKQAQDWLQASLKSAADDSQNAPQI